MPTYPCNRPRPRGWYCTRPIHDGPCALVHGGFRAWLVRRLDAMIDLLER